MSTFATLFTLSTSTTSPFQGDKALLQAAVDDYIACTVDCDDPSTTHGVASGHINTWCTAGITDMSELFKDKAAFNQNVTDWDVSSVENMGLMFYEATAFDQDINSWVVSKVTDFKDMFLGASAFNQDISGWDTSSATTMQGVFFNAKAFNQDINSWDVSKVENFQYMFYGASAFNQNIGGWNVSSVTTMVLMFYEATAFNQDLCAWKDDILTGTTTTGMFSNSGCTNKSDPTSTNVCQSCPTPSPTLSPTPVRDFAASMITVSCKCTSLCELLH